MLSLPGIIIHDMLFIFNLMNKNIVNPKAPIRYINGDTLDNKKCNLEIFNQNTINKYEEKDGVISIILKDKYGKKEGFALISHEDLSSLSMINIAGYFIKLIINFL